MSSRKAYMKNSYSKYWINARDHVYGYMPYDHELVDMIRSMCTEHGYSNLLEVAIGTGKPIASALVDSGLGLQGIDISPDLIEACRKNNPAIQCEVGDAEKLRFSNDCFDLTYCFHSTWFIPNVHQAITEMIRVVKPGGAVLFDIQNLHNKEISAIYKQHVFENKNAIGMLYKAFKNSVKFLTRRGTQDWPYVVSQTPSDPAAIFNCIHGCGVKKVQLFGYDDSLKEIDHASDYRNGYGRLMFVVSK